MRIYNIMPVMRAAFWPAIKENMQLGRTFGLGVYWIPVLFQRECDKLPADERRPLSGQEGTAWPHIIPDAPGFAMTVKANAALQVLEQIPALPGWIFMGSDDNLIPKKVWKT